MVPVLFYSSVVWQKKIMSSKYSKRSNESLR